MEAQRARRGDRRAWLDGDCAGNESRPPHTPFFRFAFDRRPALSPEPKSVREATRSRVQDGPQMAQDDRRSVLGAVGSVNAREEEQHVHWQHD